MELFCIYEVRTHNNPWNGDTEYDFEIAVPHQYFQTEKSAQLVCDKHNEDLKLQHREEHEKREHQKVEDQEKKIKRNQILAEEGLERLRTDYSYQPYKPHKYIEPQKWTQVEGYWFVKEVKVDLI